LFSASPNVQESPLRPNGDIKAKGISIAIFLGLENRQHAQQLKPEQIFEIRRTYLQWKLLNDTAQKRVQRTRR
jgi:hypothetical protein